MPEFQPKGKASADNVNESEKNAGQKGLNKRTRVLSLRDSPLMRLAASQVGRGAAASTFGDMAAAACAEAGTKHVSAGDWADNACCSVSVAVFETNNHACDIEAHALLLDWPGARTNTMLNEISWLL